MKSTLFAVLLLGATAAFGQAVAISSEPRPIQMPSHQQRASQHFMDREQTLLITSNSETSARGERPLWEAGAKPVEIPLGDVARMLRAEHATAKKAVKTLVK